MLSGNEFFLTLWRNLADDWGRQEWNVPVSLDGACLFFLILPALQAPVLVALATEGSSITGPVLFPVENSNLFHGTFGDDAG